MPRRYYSSTAARTTLSSGINSTATSITVGSTSGFPGSYPYTLIIDQDLVTEEIVTVTAGAGTTLTVTRGVDGSSGVSHSAGAAVNHGVSARDFDEPNSHVNDNTTDVHTQYVSKSLFANKGTIAAASAASTPAALSVGSNGETLVADSTTTTGLRWQPAYNAGRNRIINGSFDVWQRGTSFSANQAYTADRWNVGWDSTPTVTISRQAFTTGTAPVAGLEGTYFFRTAVTSAASMSLLDVKQYIEDVRTFAGQTVTVSFYAKADATRTLSTLMVQNFGSGGSGDVATSAGSVTLTTSWARYSLTVAVPSISGKTLGAGNWVGLYLRHPGSTFTIDLWGVQVEAGSVATRFEEEPYEATLRKCQRYYQKSYNVDVNPGTNTDVGAPAIFTQATQSYHTLWVPLGTTMRATPTVTLYSTTGASGNVRNVSAGTNIATIISGAGQRGFFAQVSNVSIAGGNDIRFQWVAEIEL